MKFFAILSLFSAFLLGFTVQSGSHKTIPEAKKVPVFLKNYKQEIKASFKRPENANMLFSFITGDKSGISPYTKKAFKKVNLSFLLSPSGIHFSCILLFITWMLNQIQFPKIKRLAKIGILFSFIFVSPFDSIKRLSILRILFQLKFLSKIKFNLEQIFIFTFIIAFLFGDYQKSPLGFIYSFIFLGTFFSLRNHSRLVLILGLFSTQLILGLFMGEKVSLISIPLGLMGSFLFTLIFPFLLIFLGSFWLVSINWAEPILRSFIVLIQTTAKLLNGTFTSSSLFLIASIWVLMMMKNSSGKCAALIVFLFLHTNTAMTPVIIH